jgi:hypothetical protein
MRTGSVRLEPCAILSLLLASAARPSVLADGGQQPSVVAVESAQEQPPPEKASGGRSSPWLLVPLVSSNPKLGTSFGALGAYLRKFDADSRVSLFGINFQYTSTDSVVASAFARTSFGQDHHRIVGIAAFGYIKNDYEDYLGTGQPLRTNDDLKALAGRYLYRVAGDWFIGGQGTATNYQVFGESAEDDLVLETLGVKGFESAALGAVVMRDSRDNEDMPRRGWYLNLNNLAYREALGGAQSFDAYRADVRVFVPEGGGHLLALRQYNWLTHDAPTAAQASVILRGYKIGQYLAPYMSSFEAEERLAFGTRFGATVFGGVASLYGDRDATSLSRQYYPAWGAGVQFILKPAERMLVNLEYAQGVEENHGIYLKFGYAW